MRTLDPMMDLVFKALFGKEDKTSKELLMALLNDILENDDRNKKDSLIASDIARVPGTFAD